MDKIINYLLRNVPPGLWLKIKHRAVDEQSNLRELIIKALTQYIKP